MSVSTISISKFLIQLFQIHNRVSLPGFGAFVAQYQPASFSSDGTHMTPPSKKIVFRTSETWNDGYLEEALAAKNKTNKTEAKKELATYLQKIFSDMNSGKKITFKEFGVLYKKADGTFQFDLAEGVNLLPESFGLQDLTVTPVLTEKAAPLEPITPLTPIETTPTITPLTTTIKPLTTPEYTAPKPAPTYTTPNKPAPSKPIVPPPAPRRNRGIGWWILLIVVILLVAAAFVFKKQLGELYDKCYYTPAEQELLKRYNAGERG